MNDKERYLQAMKSSKGQLDEIGLGASIYLDEESTRKIISLLLSEHRIEYVPFGACGYRIISKKP